MPAKRALSAALALLLVAAIPARAASVPTITVIDSINPGSGSSYAMDAGSAALGEYLYFQADDGTHGDELWRTNGTVTELVEDINTGSSGADDSEPDFFTALNGYLYFQANDGTHGFELWRTNGTVTELVEDINPNADSSDVSGFAVLGAWLYFQANDGTNGMELWRTNGTTTELVENINTNPAGPFGVGSSNPYEFAVLGSYLYFQAYDGTHGSELWRTNGGVTELVKDINTGNTGADPSWPSRFTEIGGYLFFKADGATQAGQLWRTDGTEAGTTLITDVLDPNRFTAFGNYLYFAAETDADGTELWRTDGTEAGTELLFDINDGADDSYPYNFTVVGDYLFFSADDGTHGTELWVTNGDVRVLAYDTIGGAPDADPDDFTAFGDWLYFQAETGNEGGDELWRSNVLVTERVPFPLAGQSLSDDDYGVELVVAGDRLYMSVLSALIGYEFGYLEDSLPPTNRDGSLWTTTLVILAGLTAAASIGLRVRGAKRT
jgi:ELWxxDGT repeat protein